MVRDETDSTTGCSEPGGKSEATCICRRRAWQNPLTPTSIKRLASQSLDRFTPSPRPENCPVPASPLNRRRHR